MKKPVKMSVAAAVAGLVLAGLWFFMSRPSPSRLASRALSASTLKERISAAAKLSALKSPDPTAQLRKLVQESTDPEVLSQAYKALAARLDTQSLPQFFTALDHADLKVRQAALAGVLKFQGGTLPDDIQYSAEASAEERAKVVRRLKEFHESGALLAAASPKAAPNPMVKSPTEPTPSPTESPPKEPPTKEVPGPSPASSPSHGTYAPPPPLLPTENPALTLMVWMCKILALLVLLFELAGIISLVIGQRDPRARQTTVNKKGTLPAEPAPVEKNSGVLWTKIGLLLGGAVAIVVLLTTAEIVGVIERMEQKTDRMEVKIDYLPRMR